MAEYVVVEIVSVGVAWQMAADAADELESVANAALLLALQALLATADIGAAEDSIAAGKTLDRLLLSGTHAYDTTDARTKAGVNSKVPTNASLDGADATVRLAYLTCSLLHDLNYWCGRFGVYIGTIRMGVINKAVTSALNCLSISNAPLQV